ncbi:MAG: peptide chain release factor N(5)-glutamine methyltransferase [Bacteroidales bacterium]|nr:peptide chain release factor N(5)-glutamine methyltransferase [Bacteroidales bacterium]
MKGSLRSVRETYAKALLPLYGESEAFSLFHWVAEEIMGLGRAALTARLDEPLAEEVSARFAAVLARLLRNEPVQYIFHKAYFGDLELYVDETVLIPRPETEELVRLAASQVALRGYPLRILDLCTGSGAIALALSKTFPEAEVYACDISEKALETARRNNALCGASVKFFLYDVLSGAPLPEACAPSGGFHLVISNPPYVRQSEKTQMRPNVLDYEPPLALFVPDTEPLVFYEAIASLAVRILAPDGLLVEEINEAFPLQNKRIMEEKGLQSIELHRDMQGKFRGISARKK